MKWPAEKHLQNIPLNTVAFNLEGAGKPEITFSMPQRCPLPPQAHRTERQNALHPVGLPHPRTRRCGRGFPTINPVSSPDLLPSTQASGKGVLLPVYTAGSVLLGGFPSVWTCMWPCTAKHRAAMKNHSLAHPTSSQATRA